MPCDNCPLRPTCQTSCLELEAVLDDPERGRIAFISERKSASMLRLIQNRALADTLRAHADILDEPQRKIFDLRWHDGLSTAEIGHRLGMRPSNVRYWLARIRKQLVKQAVQ